MIRRRLISIMGAVGFAIAIAVPAAAATKLAPITVAVTGVPGYPSSGTAGCTTGHDDLGNELRCAVEFGLRQVPEGATVVAATLRMNTQNTPTCSTCRVEFRSYTGDGRGGVDDLTKGTEFATRDAAGAPHTISLDVTQFIAGLLADGKLDAGIRLNTLESGNPSDTIHWDRYDSVIEVSYIFEAFVNVIWEGAGAGTVTSSPAGLHCTKLGCTGFFEVGKTITLTAKPASGSKFGAWIDYYCKGQDATCSFKVVNGDMIPTVRFDKTGSSKPTGAPATAAPTLTLATASPLPSAEPTESAAAVPSTGPSASPSASPVPTALTISPAQTAATEPEPTGQVAGFVPILSIAGLVVLAGGAWFGLRRRPRG